MCTLEPQSYKIIWMITGVVSIVSPSRAMHCSVCLGCLICMVRRSYGALSINHHLPHQQLHDWLPEAPMRTNDSCRSWRLASLTIYSVNKLIRIGPPQSGHLCRLYLTDFRATKPLSGDNGGWGLAAGIRHGADKMTIRCIASAIQCTVQAR